MEPVKRSDQEHAEALRRLLMFRPPMEGDSISVATVRAIEVLESHEARLDEWIAEAEIELRHRQEQIVEARRIADLCYEARTGDPSVVDAAIEAWLNRSWKADS